MLGWSKAKKMRRFIKESAPKWIGKVVQEQVEDSFLTSSFEGKTWKPAHRTDPLSVWYGYYKGSNTPLPKDHPRRKGSKKPFRSRGGATNFSPAATERETLKATGSLRNSFERKEGYGSVIITSSEPYAEIHNEGGEVKVFGKKSVEMPRRQMVGDSPQLRKTIKEELIRKMKAILK